MCPTNANARKIRDLKRDEPSVASVSHSPLCSAPQIDRGPDRFHLLIRIIPYLYANIIPRKLRDVTQKMQPRMAQQGGATTSPGVKILARNDLLQMSGANGDWEIHIRRTELILDSTMRASKVLPCGSAFLRWKRLRRGWRCSRCGPMDRSPCRCGRRRILSPPRGAALLPR
jgi:hypothetical protein